MTERSYRDLLREDRDLFASGYARKHGRDDNGRQFTLRNATRAGWDKGERAGMEAAARLVCDTFCGNHAERFKHAETWWHIAVVEGREVQVVCSAHEIWRALEAPKV